MSPASASRRRLFFLLALLAFASTLWFGLWLRKERLHQTDQVTIERAKQLGVAHMPNGSQTFRSDFAPLLVEEIGSKRSLFIVDEEGNRLMASSRMDVARPHDLLVPYTRTMFASYLFLPRQERVLIVGLGGGSMIRFLEHHEPDLRVDVVEIDPVVIRVAREYFGTRASENIRILERDGFQFLRDIADPYDVIYMDAFIKPSEETDGSGIPLNLKTKAFLRDIQEKVKPEGLVVFNVHEDRDIGTLREVFPQVYVFRLGAPGLVAVGTKSSRRLGKQELAGIAQGLDAQFQAGFSFGTMVERLRDPH